MLRTCDGEVGRHRVDVVGEVFPGAGDAFDLGLAAELAFGADFARHARDLGRERVQLIDHRVDGVLELKDFAAHVDGDLLGKIAAGDGGRDFGDVAHLVGEVRRHRVDVVGEILPGAGDALHLRLAAELAFGADLARHARDFGREAIELIDHRVDGVLELENLALHVDGDLAATSRRWRWRWRPRRCCAPEPVRLLAIELTLSVRSFQVPATPGTFGLAAEPAFGTDFARHARHLGGERVELIDHRVDGVLELENFALARRR